ncbi:unnamed protein product [Euphydryas editha]|uniref:RNA-directed DNA polymerase n=1 Tax=Euphydryas editha TaxID=104508 RepID=A0AAU9VA43_EUPED|nr:unnamed protein product [Euphydryas editha]
MSQLTIEKFDCEGEPSRVPTKRKIETDNNKKDIDNKRFKQQNKKEYRYTHKDTDNIHYVFRIDEDSELECDIGGVKVNMLVDSGCKCNLITSKTWHEMKSNNVNICNQNDKPDKLFYGYGSDKPLKLIGSFEARIKIADRSEYATFFVINDGTRDLLGKQTAINMGVLKIGLDINQMETKEPFPKIKDVQVHILIDDKVQPVSQPHRRIPIPLEEKKTLERILLGCEGTVNFIDDILVYGENKEIHEQRLKAVMKTLEENGIVLRKDKCLFNKTEIQFLGHEFSENGVKPLQKYVNSIQGFRPPMNIGKDNIADCLSRLCKLENMSANKIENYIHQVVEEAKPTAISLRDIIECSAEDPKIIMVKEGVYSNKWDDNVKAFKLFENELCFYEGILLRGTRIVIPNKLRRKVLMAAHEGHPGIVLMKARLRTKVWWPRYDKDAENLVKSCKGCTLVSAPYPPNPLKRRELPNEPWVDIAIDLMGPLPNGEHLLVIVDYFSRYQEIKITRQITSADIIRMLTEIFSRLGNPATITADNGKQFCSAEFKQFCTARNIVLFNIIPYWPQQNGEVERQNRDILKRLKISQAEKGHWREGLEEFLVMYNSTPHSVTGKSPAELFFKRQFRDKIPMIADINRQLENPDVRDRDQQKKQLGKEYTDKKRRAKECEIQPGDKVYLKNINKDNKLSLNYDPTPHTVEKNTGGDIEVRNDQTGQVLRRNIVHLKKVEGQWRILDNNKDEEISLEDKPSTSTGE